MILNRLLVLVFCFSPFFASAQQPHPVTNPGGCGVVGHTPWLEWYWKHRETTEFIERGADTAWLYVPVTVHIVGSDEGGGYFRTVDVFRVICELNGQYEPARIHFYLHPEEPLVWHNNTSWFDHDWDGGEELIETNRLPDRLNAFIVNDPAGNCGYSWHDAIVMGKGCSGGGNSTWAHEAGHHFSLPHTFLGWEGRTWQPGNPAPNQIGNWAKVEKFDGSNCKESGDRFCDTRADYLSYRWSCNGDRESNVVLTDPTGVDFKADATYYMSYSNDACTDKFSAEQIEAMRTNLYDEHTSYLQEWQLGPQIDDAARVQPISPVDTNTVQYNKIDLTWEPVANAEFYTVEVALLPHFPFALASRTVHNTTSTTITTINQINKILYWRVRAHSTWDVCQPNNNSPVGVFKTVNLSATNDLERVANIQLLPNPVSAGISAQLLVESSENLDATLQLVDMNGRTIFAKPSPLAFGSNQLDIETNELATGIYSVILQTPKGTVIKKLAIIE